MGVRRVSGGLTQFSTFISSSQEAALEVSTSQFEERDFEAATMISPWESLMLRPRPFVFDFGVERGGASYQGQLQCSSICGAWISGCWVHGQTWGWELSVGSRWPLEVPKAKAISFALEVAESNGLTDYYVEGDLQGKGPLCVFAGRPLGLDERLSRLNGLIWARPRRTTAAHCTAMYLKLY